MKNNPLDFINSLIDYQPFSVAPTNPEVSAFSSEPPLDKQQLLKNYLEIKKQKSNPQPVMQQPMEPQPVETQAVEPQPPVDNRNRLAEVAAGMGAALAGRNPMDVLNSFENKRKLEFDREQNKLKLADEKAQQDWENKFREKQLSETIASRKEIAAMQKADRKKMESSPEFKAAKLNANDKARFDNALMAIKGLDEMAKALDAGQNTFSIIGDNDYTAAARRATEAYGRMQSGGAINKEEEERFNKTLPTSKDSAEIQRKKLITQRNEMISRLKTLGFNPEDVGLSSDLNFSYGDKNSFPKQVRKGNQIATVNNEDELNEALQEGWQ